MIARQFIHLNFSSLRPPAIVNKHKFLCTESRVRFCSGHRKDDPTSLRPDDNDDRKEKIIKMELAHFRDQGANVPDVNSIKPKHWTELMKLTTKSARQRFYYFLFTIEKHRENEKMIKQQKALLYAAFKERQANEGSTSPAKKSTFFLRIYKSTVNMWRNNRLRRAMQFGDKIIFDCSYDQYMTRQESKSAGNQLELTFVANRLHKDPFDLHFCNVHFNGGTMERLASKIPTLRDEAFPLNLHERSYLDVFPKEKLVYLTPHCKNDLTDYDPDSIYIIGAMVDTSNHEPLSMMKAKELGIKMARLPLDRYLNWGMGDKTLTLDQMMKIMLAWKTSRSWDTALEHVPRRKVMNKDFGKPKVSRRNSTATANPSQKIYDFDAGSMRKETSSTTEKFKRKIGTDNQWSNINDERNTLSTAEKFKLGPKVDFSQSDDTAGKLKKRSSKSNVNLKKLFDK